MKKIKEFGRKWQILKTGKKIKSNTWKIEVLKNKNKAREQNKH